MVGKGIPDSTLSLYSVRTGEISDRSAVGRKEAIMERLSRFAAGAVRVLRSRLFAAAVLVGATLTMAALVSVYSHAVTVTDGEQSRVVLTMHSDPYKAVETAGMSVANYDLLQVDPDAGTVAISRAMTVEVQADGLSTLLHMTDGTVAQALRRADVTVGTYDKVSVDLQTAVSDGMSIKVDRVAYEEYSVVETIPYETVTRFTTVLSPGRTKVHQYGSEGSKTLTYRKTIVNGEVAETVLTNEKITKQPVNQILLKGASYGTPLSSAPFDIELDAKGQPVNYKTLYAGKSCTAYSIGTRGASGMRLGVGTVAVNPNIIPYGTKLWITSADGKFVYGYAIAADTGAFASGTRTFCDVYMGSYAEACLFGRRTLNIYVLE